MNWKHIAFVAGISIVAVWLFNKYATQYLPVTPLTSSAS